MLWVQAEPQAKRHQGKYCEGDSGVRLRQHGITLTDNMASGRTNVLFVNHPTARWLGSRPTVQCVRRFWGIQSTSFVDTGHANSVSAQTETTAQSVVRNSETILNTRELLKKTLVTLNTYCRNTYTTITATTTNASSRILHHQCWASHINVCNV